jgi:hypothetical protein
VGENRDPLVVVAFSCGVSEIGLVMLRKRREEKERRRRRRRRRKRRRKREESVGWGERK